MRFALPIYTCINKLTHIYQTCTSDSLNSKIKQWGYLGNRHILLTHILHGQILPRGGQSLAVSTPGGIKFNEVAARFNVFGEGVIGEVKQPSRGNFGLRFFRGL